MHTNTTLFEGCSWNRQERQALKHKSKLSALPGAVLTPVTVRVGDRRRSVLKRAKHANSHLYRRAS